MHRKPNTSQRIRVLLVDDETAFVAVLKKRLEHRGINVMSAGGGSEAIQLLRVKDFDVAILDLKMEDMDGIEVLKIFKKMTPGMPVIMLTGHGSESSAREGLRLDAFDYLTKPCELNDIINKISDAVQSAHKENIE